MPNYRNSVIYKICCRDPAVKDVYIGSTTNLRSRRAHHSSCAQNPEREQYVDFVYDFIREHGGWDNWQVVQLEAFPCDTKTELLMKEREWCEKTNSTLNAQVRRRNEDHQPTYYERNREEILRKRKIRYDIEQNRTRTMRKKIKELEEKEKRDEAELAELEKKILALQHSQPLAKVE